MTAQVLVVGAGFAGAVYARLLAEAGYTVRVIDRRDHIAGNCFDKVDQTGVRYHRYGPHLFHTSNQTVVAWLSKFTEWLPYEHRVVARLADGRLVPLPVNRVTIGQFFGVELETPEEAQAFLATKIVEVPGDSAKAFLYGTIGPDLTETFYRRYTQKMWGYDLADVDAAIVRRLKIRLHADDRYFPDDSFQALPRDGYTALFERIFDHPAINVDLGVDFDTAMLDSYIHCFNSMPIDEFHRFSLGELPYRSIRFHHAEVDRALAPDHATINYTDSGKFTRETWWHNIAGHDGHGASVLRTVEEPCDFRDNAFERYYPVHTSDGGSRSLYEQYAALSAADLRVTFIGRCGTFQYLDMHQVVNQSLIGARRWLDGRSAAIAA